MQKQAKKPCDRKKAMTMKDDAPCDEKSESTTGSPTTNDLPMQRNHHADPLDPPAAHCQINPPPTVPSVTSVLPPSLPLVHTWVASVKHCDLLCRWDSTVSSSSPQTPLESCPKD